MYAWNDWVWSPQSSQGDTSALNIFIQSNFKFQNFVHCHVFIKFQENNHPGSIPVVIMSSENDPQRIKRFSNFFSTAFWFFSFVWLFCHPEMLLADVFLLQHTSIQRLRLDIHIYNQAKLLQWHAIEIYTCSNLCLLKFIFTDLKRTYFYKCYFHVKLSSSRSRGLFLKATQSSRHAKLEKLCKTNRIVSDNRYQKKGDTWLNCGSR